MSARNILVLLLIKMMGWFGLWVFVHVPSPWDYVLLSYGLLTGCLVGLIVVGAMERWLLEKIEKVMNEEKGV